MRKAALCGAVFLFAFICPSDGRKASGRDSIKEARKSAIKCHYGRGAVFCCGCVMQNRISLPLEECRKWMR